MVVPVIAVRMVISGSSALTGRMGRHSTAGLSVIAAATLVLAQLDQGIGCSHPHFGCERGVVCGPVGEEGRTAWVRPRFLTGSLTHRANTTADAVIAPVNPAPGRRAGCRCCAMRSSSPPCTPECRFTTGSMNRLVSGDWSLRGQHGGNQVVPLGGSTGRNSPPC